MGSALTVNSALTSTATVGLIFATIASYYFKNISPLIAFFIGIIFELTLNHFLYKNFKTNLWYLIFNRHAIPFGINMIITGLLLILLAYNENKHNNKTALVILILVAIKYIVIIKKSLFPSINFGVDYSAAQNWWRTKGIK